MGIASFAIDGAHGTFVPSDCQCHFAHGRFTPNGGVDREAIKIVMCEMCRQKYKSFDEMVKHANDFYFAAYSPLLYSYSTAYLVTEQGQYANSNPEDVPPLVPIPEPEPQVFQGPLVRPATVESWSQERLRRGG